jgi:deferrochelatase/peroxidase EfeB
MTDPPVSTSRLSRRTFLRSAAAATGVAVVGGVGGIVGFELAGAGASAGSPTPAAGAGAIGSPVALGSPGPVTAAAALVPFRDVHQAGIATPTQDRLAFAAFDVTGSDRATLVTMLKDWTLAAELMTLGQPVGTQEGQPLAPPEDTGEAVGLHPGRLTITIGFGPGLFDDRFGLATARPSALSQLPRFAGDFLEPQRSAGDIAIQACADDPQLAFHAVRNLARLGRGSVVMRWFQLGFGRTSSTSSSQATARNLQGFKDGTNNIVAENSGLMRDHVWVGPETDQPWMRDGSYLVTRRIRMLIESWDRTSLGEQERVIGRHKMSGAPLGGVNEHDTVDLAAVGGDGVPVVAMDAHIRQAAASAAGERILRRGYSYTDGIDPKTGLLDAGLFFIAYQQDPRNGFIPIQSRLASQDSLNEYIRHTGSAVFACPPGLAADAWWGQTLFG